ADSFPGPQGGLEHVLVIFFIALADFAGWRWSIFDDMSASDLELLARYARQGAEDAFAEVVSRHAGLVYAAALRVTRTPQLAEEVVQAALLDLASNATKLRPDTVLATWLYSVTRDIAANTVRGE